MEALKIFLTVVLILLCVVLTVIILFQEGNSVGLGSLSGQRLETYWSKNKKRSREGLLVRGTAVMVIIFFAIVLLLNTNLF
ncbi:MAG: preprotein translocase subunit SecG [Lachnospiraceae bacterium]|jgi:preprotein translocase subunit SecG|nr:preprotein translocase subunit SecG [Lachnospiraceae bacterium]MBQ6259164.1 preprotein translocase subunit SecG [Lachnospiraceae bacterium]